MRIGRMLTVILVVVLVAPGAVLAQSAGDEQYTDPFQNVPSDDGGNQGGSGSQGGQEGPGSQGGDPGAGEPVAPTEPVVPDTSGTTEVPAAPTTAPGGDGLALPRTGVPTAVLAVLGTFLLAAGVTLRRAI